METTSRKVVAISKPRSRAKINQKATVRKFRTTQNTTPTTTSKPTNKTVRKSGTKPLAQLQDKVTQALSLMFGNATNVDATYVSNGTAITITMRHNGHTATITLSEDMKGGQQL